MVGIISLIGQQGLSFDLVNEIMSKSNAVALARCAKQTDGKSERITCRVDFGAQSAARAAKALGIRPPLTLRAPAACW